MSTSRPDVILHRLPCPEPESLGRDGRTRQARWTLAARGIIWLLLVLLATPSVLSGCSSGTQSHREPTPSHRHAPSPTPRANDPEVEPSDIEMYAREHFPDQYAGVAPGPRGTIAIYRVPSREFDRSLQRQFGIGRIVFRDAQYSERDLQQLTEQVLGETDYWMAQGVDIQGARLDFICGVVEILTPDADAARPLFADRYEDRVVAWEGAIAPSGGLPEREHQHPHDPSRC